MRRPLGRWSLLVVAVAVAAAAGYWVLTLEQRSLEIRRQLGALENHDSAMHASLGDARRALAAMASPGQAAEGWSRQAKSAIEASATTLAALSAALPATAFDPSRDALGKLTEAEDRIRGFAVGGRPLLAGDVAFGEALPLLDDLDGHVSGAVRQAATASTQQMAALRDQQAAALAGALAALLLAALVLTPLPRASTTPVADAVGAEADPSLLGLAATAAIQPAIAAPIAATAAAPPNVDALAGVCAELSAMVDGAELPAVLARVARALGASGVIVWLADAAGSSLGVVAFHGYDARLIERLGAIGADDDNPTSRAFRSAAAIAAPPRAGQNAATAVPIAGPRGVVGVLSAELTATDPAALAYTAAAARIVAAQLAALLGGPAPAEPSLDGTAEAQR